MNAAVLTNFGDDECLSITTEHPIPTSHLEAGLVRIRVHACALSSLDTEVRQGLNKMVGNLPLVPGYEISGVVTDIGAEVSHIKPTDEVFGLIPCDSQLGGCCDTTIQSAFHFVVKPNEISHEDAAACVGPGICAFDCLMHMEKGDTVLVLGGASAIGHIVVQLAANRGGRVFATSKTKEEMNYLQDMPEDTLARVIHTSTDDMREAVMKETGGTGVKYIIDCSESDDGAGIDVPWAPALSAGHLGQLISCLCVHGSIYTCNGGVKLSANDAIMMKMKNAGLSFLNEQSWVLSDSQLGKFQHILRSIAEMLVKGVFQPRTRLFQLGKIRSAHRAIMHSSDRPVVRTKGE